MLFKFLLDFTVLNVEITINLNQYNFFIGQYALFWCPGNPNQKSLFEIHRKVHLDDQYFFVTSTEVIYKAEFTFFFVLGYMFWHGLTSSHFLCYLLSIINCPNECWCTQYSSYALYLTYSTYFVFDSVLRLPRLLWSTVYFIAA